MTTKHKVPQYKVKIVEDLKKLAKESKTILLASIKGLPGSQFQEISKKLRGKAIVKVPKKNLSFRSIDESKIEGVEGLKDKIENSVAILYSDLDAFDLAADLIKSKSPAKAKAGQIAPEDIIAKAGPTDLVPGPAISELGAVGIPIQIKEGKIEIKMDKVLTKAGEVISPPAADIMSKLGMRPFSIGFIPLAAFDTKEKKFYPEIKIDTEGTLADLKNAYGRALPFAVSIGYTSKDTIAFLLSKANAQAMKINRIMTGEPEPVATPVVKAEAPKEEKKKEEPKAAAAEGLGALFG